MATTLTSVNVTSSINISGTDPQAFPGNTGIGSSPAFVSPPFSVGTSAAGQVNKASFPIGTFAGVASTVTLQLSSGGTLTDVARNSVAFGAVGFVRVVNFPGSGITLNFAPSTTHPVVWGQLPSAGLVITPGSVCDAQDYNIGMAVGAAGTADQVQVTTSGAGSCGFILLGR